MAYSSSSVSGSDAVSFCNSCVPVSPGKCFNSAKFGGLLVYLILHPFVVCGDVVRTVRNKKKAGCEDSWKKISITIWSSTFAIVTLVFVNLHRGGGRRVIF